MKKLTVFAILLAIALIAVVILSVNRQPPKNPNTPKIYGNPYRGGPGSGHAFGEYTGRVDGK